MHLRVFVSSPGDAADERDRARSLLKDELPYRAFLRGKVTFDVVSWDDPAARVPMLATLTPQESVNQGMPKPSACHIVVVVLWSRMGTELPAAIRRVVPVPSLAGTAWESRYLSGTEWEFEDAVHAGPVPGTERAPEVLVYRRRAQLPEVLAFHGVSSRQDQRFSEVLEQLDRVETFFARFQDPGGGLARGVTPYHSPGEFHDRLAADVEKLVKQRLDEKPERVVAVSNVPVRVPAHFVGRDEALAAVEAALGRDEGRVAITALHGLRGVGKTTLAAAYCERHRADYRATWWVRAQTEPTMRADLVALGVRLGWVGAEDKEEPALAAVTERLRHEGEGVLLVYDNALDARTLTPYLPRGGAARVLVTSNAHAWRGVAEPVEIRLWPKAVGAEYLLARTGRGGAELEAAEALSEALGGLPLAHEQAAAYCERLEVALSDYGARFAAAPARMLDTERYAPAEYHDGRTVAKAFGLAIGEAAKQHRAAEPLIAHLALLAPEPIPLFLLREGRAAFDELLAGLLAGDGLDEALAALRAFALVDRETVADEREPDVRTETVRLHRLVREVAAARLSAAARDGVRQALITVLAAVYPGDVYDNPRTWPRARRLDALALALVGGGAEVPEGMGGPVSWLLDRLASYRQMALAAYAQARPLFERALAIRETVLGPAHPHTATSLSGLAVLLQAQGDLAGARPLFERALAIRETALGPKHPDTATSLGNLAVLLRAQGDLAAARPLCERALAIREKALGPAHPDTATSLHNLAVLLREQGDLAAARPLYERALAIYEAALGPEHPYTAASLNNLAVLLREQGDLAAARPLFERALAIREKALGPAHPHTATSLSGLAALLHAQGDLAAARPLCERALAICETVLGPAHPHTATSLNSLAALLHAQGDLAARPLFERALAIRETALGPAHPDTAAVRNSLAELEGQ